MLFFSANVLSVGAKEPDKADVKVFFNAYYPKIEGYTIDGRYYYKIEDFWDGINKCTPTDKPSIRKNEETGKYEIYLTTIYAFVNPEELVKTEPSFRVYPYKDRMNGDRTVWATEDTETGERNAYLTKDPYVYMRDRIFRPNESSVNITSLNGEEMTFKRYEINGEYFYDIEQLCALVGSEFRYSDPDKTVHVLTRMGDYCAVHPQSYDFGESDFIFYNGNYGHMLRQYFKDNNDGTFSTFDYSRETLNSAQCFSAYTYNKSDFSPISHYLVPIELEYFCGYFSGKNYNYIVYGAHNYEEIPDKEIIRVVKYDKSFNRLSSLSLTSEQCYAIVIMEAGSMRMAENGNELAVHTSRLRMKSDDGKNHQSQLTLLIDTDTMTLKNNTGPFQTNHVSHSFNQFVKYDGNDPIYLDLGDAYPRAIVITTPSGPINVLNIPGEIGDNYTGVRLGDFEITDTNYLVAYNKDNYDNPSIRERDAFLAVCNKSTHEIKTIQLTDLAGTLKWATEPYLVELPGNRYLLMWGEYFYDLESWVYRLTDTKYVVIDSYGNFLSEVFTSQKNISPDLEPIYMDNAVYWYRDTAYGRLFYRISLDPSIENPVSVYYNGEEIAFDQKPIIENGRTLVPLRAIFEKLGASVEWDDTTKTVTAEKNGTKISLSAGNATALNNGQSVTLDVPAKIINGRTFVPLRFISDCFSVSVSWDPMLKKVALNSWKISPHLLK